MEIFGDELPKDEEFIGTLTSLQVRRMRAEIQQHPEWDGSSIMSNGFTVGQMLRIYQRRRTERTRQKRLEKKWRESSTDE